MHVLGILYSDKDGVFKSRPFAHGYTLAAYRRFSEICRQSGIKAVVAKPDWYRNGKLSLCWNILADKAEKNADVDFIFDRCTSTDTKHYLFMKELRKGIAGRLKILNGNFVEDVCNDKYRTYRFLGRHMPGTFLSLKEAGLLPDDMAVIKPRFGAQGRGVSIKKMKEIKKLEKGFVAQRFIDTSSGIAETRVRGVHDMRLVMLNGKIMDFYVRAPKKGLISNISLGGRMIRISKIPESAIRLGRRVDSKLRKFNPRFYSIDLMFDKGQKPWIAELNAHPALDVYYEFKMKCHKEIYDKLCHGIADSIKRCM